MIEYGTRTLVAKLEDREGDLLSFIIKVDYKIDGILEIENYSYWPENEDMRASVEDYIYQEFS